VTGCARPAVACAVLLFLAGCGGDDDPAPVAAKKPAASGAADAGKAASDFVTGVREGDGAGACKTLTAVEQKIFITGAADIKPALDTATCQSVVESFHTSAGTKARLLDGELQEVLVTGDFATGRWVYAGNLGDQMVIMEKTAAGWQFTRDQNDFPTALLHFFDEG
jgi:hypothetical protein